MSDPDFNKLRKSIDESESVKVCPTCNKECILMQGRVSLRWFWRHKHVSDCPNNGVAAAIFFNTREEAILAPKIFTKNN